MRRLIGMCTELEAFFQPAANGGQRLYLLHLPPAGQAPRGAVVYAHPWAEEMNKSRRMAALAARALAADGWAVLQLDLAGCGDSSGDFADASWATWVDDVAAAAQWLHRRHLGVPLWLWGLRTGALLCTAAAAALKMPAHLLLWQPVLQGRQALQQFLRLKAAAQMAQMAQGGGKAAMDAARAELAAGRPVAVAGYLLPPALAAGLEAARLEPPGASVSAGASIAPSSPTAPDTPATLAFESASPRRLVWIEVAGAEPAVLSPAAQAALPGWSAAGWLVDAHAVAGPAFWQTVEIETAPVLLAATRDALAATHQSEPAVAA